MTLPSWRDWIFSAKTFAAAMLALYVALKLDLQRPYWAVATVYITSQLLAGATRSKAVYRVAGTMLGAAMTVILVPNLVNAPMLLCLSIALWVGGCLYVSLLDRTPRSYLFILAGYTTALIGFPAVSEPGAMFDIAIARAEEISVGILCASLASSIVLPEPVATVIADRLDEWRAECGRPILQALGGGGIDQVHGSFLRLAAGAVALETFAKQLSYEAVTRRRSAQALATLRQHMLMLLPIVSGVADRIEALRALEAVPAETERLTADVRAWLRSDDRHPVAAAQLRAKALAAAPPNPLSWNELLVASLMTRLVNFIDLVEDMRALNRHAKDGSAPTFLKFRYVAAARDVRHRDHGMALRSALCAFVAVLVTCAIWIATGWPEGSVAAMEAAVTCCLFASLDDPAPVMLTFANSAIIGAVGAAVYLFVMLPLATNFESLVLMLAPALLACGVLMQQPRTALLALGAVLVGLTLIAIQSSYVADFAPFVNSAMAVTGGIWVAAIVTRIMRSVDGVWSARRLLGVNRLALVAAAHGGGLDDGVGLAALMLDRLGLLAPRLASLAASDDIRPDRLFAEVRAGVNIVELRRARGQLTPEARRPIDRILAAAARHFGGGGGSSSPALLAAIDAGLDAAKFERGREARLALVGLRRALFSDAAPYQPTPVEPIALGQAA